MKSPLLFLFTCISLNVFAQTGFDSIDKPLKRTTEGYLLIDDFEMNEVGDVPVNWFNRDIKETANDPKEIPSFKYRVMEENGNKYLHYEHTKARHLALPLAKKENLNIFETPILSWKWRVDKLPENANEVSEELNDAAASIYVVFDMGRVAFVKKVPKSIRYTWSSTLPKNKEASVFFGNQKIVVVESGEEEVGKGWITFERNILEDYKRLFGDNPPETPLAILLLSDGNSTNSTAIADYDDIMFKPGKGK